MLRLRENVFAKWENRTSSVIRQKGESKTGVSREQSTSNFLKNEHFLPPDTHTYARTCAYQGVSNVRFWKIWGALFS